MSIDTHGFKMVGLKKASGETCDTGDYCKYFEIFYHRDTGEIWTKYQVSLGRNSWTEYDDPAIIKVCDTSTHMSMQAIVDAIDVSLALSDARHLVFEA